MGPSYPPFTRSILGRAVSLGAAALLLLTAAARAGDAPDKRWSLVYHVGENIAPGTQRTPAPVRQFSSVVDVRGLSPQDSPDVAVLPSSIVTQSEISTFVDPNDPNTVFVSANATDWPVTTVFGTGVYWSTDGGTTWAGDDHGPGGVSNSGDPAAVIRAKDDSWVVGYISTGFGQGVSYTKNHGATWTHVNLFPSGTLDKNHLMVDNIPTSPYYGNLYSAWSNLGGGTSLNDIDIVHSTDGGATWDATATDISANVNAGSHNQGINIQIGPNGEVYAVWAIYDCWPCEEIAMGFNSSLDGGATWTGEHRAITNILGHRNTALPNSQGERRNSFPSMAVDVSGGPNDGAIYVVWTNQGVPGINTGDVDIYCAKSTDGGATFGTAVRVNQDTTTNAQWFPWIACDPVTGILTCIFYDRRDDPGDLMARAYMATSVDGGATWDDFAVGDVSFTPVPIPGLAGGYMGDYLGLAVNSGRAYPSFTDNRSGNYLTYVSPILVADPTDPNPPSNAAAVSDYTTPTSVALSWTDPTTFADGTPLVDFSIDIYKDDVLLTNIDQGNESYMDSGLTDGQLYKYTLQSHEDITDSLSVPININVYAGGSPIPAPPTGVTATADTISATVTWTNPTTQSDGTTLDDFAGLRVYRNGTFLVELARAASDTGSVDQYVDNPTPGFVYTYSVSAIDSEAPVNESSQASAVGTFVGSVPNILIWQPVDALTNSGTELLNDLTTLGESAYLTSDLFAFSPDLLDHEIVMACVGIYSNNHVIDVTEGSALDNFVQNGGRLYLEGGDCFNFDSTYDIKPIFGLAAGSDGSADLFGVIGINDLAGFSFTYTGGNNFIDELVPVTSSAIFQNDQNSDLVAVFEPSYGSGRSIGASFEYGGLNSTGPLAAQPLTLSDWVRSPFSLEGERLPTGLNPVKEAMRVAPEDRQLVPVVPRAVNTETWTRPTEAPRIAGGLGGALPTTAANTRVDLMAAYLNLLRATGNPVMVTSTNSLNASVEQDSTSTLFFSVNNPGSLNDDLIFTVTEDPDVPWLVATPAADTLGANGASQINVDFDATGMSIGTYNTSLIVAGNDPVNTADTVAVTLDVIGLPSIGVTPASLAMQVPLSGTREDSVTISNTGLAPLDYTLNIVATSGLTRDEFPSTANATTNGGAYRGNVYQVDTSIPLKKIEQYLNITTATQLEFFVYENTASTGTFTKIFSTTVTSGTGTGWQSSGAIDVPLNAGMFYLIGCGWMGQTTFYDDAGGTGLPATVSFGSLLWRGGGNSYPPPATSTVSGNGNNISSQALETGDPAVMSLLSPSSGTVPVSGSAVVHVQADGGAVAGVYTAELDVTHNDPHVGTVVVPIQVTVTDATPAPLAVVVPTSFALHTTVPNPARGETSIRYDLPRAVNVKLSIFDVTGRLVRTLRDGPEDAGFRTAVWDGRDATGQRVASGVYFYALNAGDQVFRKKMVMLR